MSQSDQDRSNLAWFQYKKIIVLKFILKLCHVFTGHSSCF